MNYLSQNRKQLDVTQDMLGQIKLVTGTDVSADDIVVFEASVFNTLPLNKKGSLYDGARASRSMVEEMIVGLNSGEQNVPLHTLHQQNWELPVGKVFQGYLNELPSGDVELRAQFYIPKTETELVEKINLSVLDEVSVGVQAKQMLCSKCGFDYFGEEADFDNFWERTCNNGHVIGDGSTHVKLVGLETWMELSLVSRGAAKNPKILSRAKSLIPQETQDRLAASGHPVEATVLFASPTPSIDEKELEPMPKEPKAEVQEFDAQAAHTELLGKFDALIELMAASAEEPVEEVEQENSEVEALKAQVGDLEGQIAELSKPKAEEMTQDLPVGGVAASAVTDAGDAPTFGAASAYKSRK